MKIFNLFALGLCLFVSSMEGIGFSIGPFSMQFDVETSYYGKDHKDILDFPLCFAISNQKKVDMVVETKEKMSSKEMRITTKRLLIEPYAFGVDKKEGKPVLQGNIVHEKLIKEVLIKYGEDKFNEEWGNKKEENYFSGWFKSDKSQNIDIEKITNLYVVQDSHFDTPKNYKGIKDDNIKVICQLPVKE